MPQFIAAALVVGIMLGFSVEYKISRAEIEHMELAIQAQKAEAQTLLSGATERIAKAEAVALDANQQLEKSHESAINSINALHDSLGAARLRDPGRRPGRCNALPASASSGQPENQADSAELSAELTRFLVDQSYQADQVAAYASECHAFVIEHNCGLPKD
jgi:hypothetical protein